MAGDAHRRQADGLFLATRLPCSGAARSTAAHPWLRIRQVQRLHKYIVTLYHQYPFSLVDVARGLVDNQQASDGRRWWAASIRYSAHQQLPQRCTAHTASGRIVAPLAVKYARQAG